MLIAAEAEPVTALPLYILLPQVSSPPLTLEVWTCQMKEVSAPFFSYIGPTCLAIKDPVRSGASHKPGQNRNGRLGYPLPAIDATH